MAWLRLFAGKSKLLALKSKNWNTMARGSSNILETSFEESY